MNTDDFRHAQRRLGKKAVINGGSAIDEIIITKKWGREKETAAGMLYIQFAAFSTSPWILFIIA